MKTGEHPITGPYWRCGLVRATRYFLCLSGAIADLMMETFEYVEAMMHRSCVILSSTETAAVEPSDH